MSSDDVVVRVRNVGKCYEIYDKTWHRLWQMIFPTKENLYKEFWALKNISFELKKGDCLGILGVNGSGKSTLLQILAGTLSQTTGDVEVNGRVAALLELGCGFNPEFTGIENVYLNASILGFSRKEIKSRLPSIIEFADIGDFISRPVKTYSSGMLVRLAFAVQSQIDPDILIIDEALAVGDARFQLKCFNRLKQLKKSGTTILFVSHATEQMKSFCNMGLTINEGQSIYWGDSKAAIIRYQEIIFPEEKQEILRKEKRGSRTFLSSPSKEYSLEVSPNSMEIKTFGVGGTNLEWINIKGLEQPNIFRGGEKLTVQCFFSWDQSFINELIAKDGLDNNVTIGISIANSKGEYLFGCNGFDANVFIDCNENSDSEVEFQFDMPFFKSGAYFMTVAIALGNQDHHIQLKWYDYLIQLECCSSKKNIYGILYQNYKMEKIGGQ